MKKSLSNLVKAGILGTSLLFANPIYSEEPKLFENTSSKTIQETEILTPRERLKDSILDYSKKYARKNQDNRLTENLYTAMQNAYLSYNDLYLQTIPVLGKEGVKERNPITKYLFESGHIELKYLLNLAGISAGNYLNYKINKTGKLATAFNLGLLLLQAHIITDNQKNLKKNSKLPRGMIFPVTIELFHLRY
jgi:hypothetical protein